MQDPILKSFLKRQYEEGMALAASSDILNLVPLRDMPPTQYVLEFHCKGVTRVGETIGSSDVFAVGLRFPPDYLRRVVNAGQILMWLHPSTIFHPNIGSGFICCGQIRPGTGIVDLAHRVFEIITFQKLTPDEHDALNRDACVWARQNMQLFPVDDRPLKRRPGFSGSP